MNEYLPGSMTVSLNPYADGVSERKYRLTASLMPADYQHNRVMLLMTASTQEECEAYRRVLLQSRNRCDRVMRTMAARAERAKLRLEKNNTMPGGLGSVLAVVRTANGLEP